MAQVKGVRVVDVGEWLDIREAAERQKLSDTTIRNHIKKGTLPSVKRVVTGRDGRMVTKRLVRVADLDIAFPPRSTTYNETFPTESMPWRQRVRILKLLNGGSIEEYKRDLRDAAREAGVELNKDGTIKSDPRGRPRKGSAPQQGGSV